ncbi:hypothetical protein COT64_03100, partial [Candidatus Shapirobacteria bacterium CG09_land_8_20_14_0_10_39_12]
PSKSRAKNILIVGGKTYQFKVTIFYQESKIWQRLLIFYFCLLFIYFLLNIYKGIFSRWKTKI